MNMSVWLLVLLSYSPLLVPGKGTNDIEDTCEKTVTGVQDHWSAAGTSSCFQLKETNGVGKAFSCVKVIASGTKCGIRHGHESADVEERRFSLSNIAFMFLRIFTVFSPTHTIHRPSVCLSPFVKQYIRVDCEKKMFEISISTVFDTSCLMYMALGILLFYSAERLSTSVKFYYTGGVGIGILASLLVLTFVLSRLVPKRPAMYAILLGGWSFSAWVINLLWHNWNILLAKYYSYFLMYLGITGFCSFIFCYWNGPIENPRSKNIVKWVLQLLGLLFLYNSSQLPMVSLAIVLGVSVVKLQSDDDIMKKVARVFWRMRPQPRKLLTEEEYRLQAEVETKKALEELRQFCHSPECSPWRTLSRMKSPERFIKFVDGEDHVTDAEMTLHDADLSDSENEDAAALIPDDEIIVDNRITNGPVAGESDHFISDDESS